MAVTYKKTVAYFTRPRYEKKKDLQENAELTKYTMRSQAMMKPLRQILLLKYAEL